jgi:pimeloyl-ACP methyl ester carboxylesterase
MNAGHGIIPSRGLGTTPPGAAPVNAEITAFHVSVPQADLEDLKVRLARTRWPERETVGDWSQGVPLAYLQEICGYWGEGYDWRRCEARLNSFPQFRTLIDDVDIHFLHVRSPEPGAVPLVLTHGWPGTVIEFLDVIDPLTRPAAHGGVARDAFHVVVPSLPGFGFSGKPRVTGWNRERIASAWVELMRRLGYDRFAAQGGDWGASVANRLGVHHAEHIIGIHANLVAVSPPPDRSDFTDEDRDDHAEWERAMASHGAGEMGYVHQQRTRPQTLGYGLADSPAGQCAWVLEKFKAWSDCGDDPADGFGIDRLLDNISTYWLTASGASSARLYWEAQPSTFEGSVDVPFGGTIFPKEISRPPRKWAERVYTDLRYWNEADRGGHFAAFEVPEIFVSEVRAAFRTMR